LGGRSVGLLSEEAQSFLRQILTVDVTHRLGSNAGVDEVMKHPFFADVNFEKIYLHTPPYVPPLASSGSGDDTYGTMSGTLGFDDSSLQAVDMLVAKPKADKFHGFTMVSPSSVGNSSTQTASSSSNSNVGGECDSSGNNNNNVNKTDSVMEESD